MEALKTTTRWPRRSTSLFKAELVRNRGPWKGIDNLDITTAEHIDWCNHRRLHGEIGLVPPAEHEDDFYRHNPVATASPDQFRAPTEAGAGQVASPVPMPDFRWVDCST